MSFGGHASGITQRGELKHVNSNFVLLFFHLFLLLIKFGTYPGHDFAFRFLIEKQTVISSLDSSETSISARRSVFLFSFPPTLSCGKLGQLRIEQTVDEDSLSHF